MSLNQADFLSARSKAIAYIGISHISSGRVRDKLLHTGFDSALCDEVVMSLITDGYIDDLRVARNIAALRTGRKSESRQRLSSRLYSAGISDAVISEVMLGVGENDVLIDQLIRSCYSTEMIVFKLEKDRNSWLLKAVRFLSNRGFSSELSVNALKNYLNDIE
jgi:SOS response regulatory protein OraA/RecX